MSSPDPPTLQQLRSLDKSTSGFRDQLGKVLDGEEYSQCVPNLQGDDLVWLVDYLDEALGALDRPSDASQKCLRELRNICSNRAILPTSYALSPDLLTINPHPFASGGLGDVYEGTFNDTMVSIKRVRAHPAEDTKFIEAFYREAIMWKHLKHPNVVPLLGITSAPLQVISEWMSGGNLPGYIKENPDVDRLRLLSDVAEGLCYLHSHNVIHGDVRGPNILVDGSGRARIVDFGLTTVTQSLDPMQRVSRQRVHTVRWSAPEVLNEEVYSKEADIFAFAMVMVEAFTSTIPFGNGSFVMAMLAIMQGGRPPRPTHPAFTEKLWTLMQRCWAQDPRSRPNASEVLEALLTPEDPPWKRLIGRTLATEERISLITTIFLDNDQVEMVEHLTGNDAQAFIDVVDGALDSLSQGTREKCLHYLRGICGRKALLPKSLTIPLCYDSEEDPLYSSPSADLRKGRHDGQDVAVKVLKLWPRDDTEQIKRRFCREVATWRVLRHQNLLPLLGVTVTENLLVVASKWMERGNVMEFVKAEINIDRARLLGDVTMGLMYMHSQGIIHGNLKGANILINDDGRACLTGFNLLRMASDQSTISPMGVTGDTIRRLSPERLHPEHFGFKESHPTKESDCYALGMVIYEVLTGSVPFAQLNDTAVLMGVLNGERPEKPQGEEGAWFTPGLWEVLELCWKPKPGDRPNLDTVLQCLQEVAPPSRLPGDGGNPVPPLARRTLRNAREMLRAMVRPFL